MQKGSLSVYISLLHLRQSASRNPFDDTSMVSKVVSVIPFLSGVTSANGYLQVVLFAAVAAFMPVMAQVPPSPQFPPQCDPQGIRGNRLCARYIEEFCNSIGGRPVSLIWTFRGRIKRSFCLGGSWSQGRSLLPNPRNAGQQM